MVKKHVWLIAGSLGIGLLVGRLSAPAGTARAEDDAEGAKDRIARSSGRTTDPSSASRNRFASLQKEVRNAPADKVSGLLYRSLESADPNERNLLASECLAAMDASNWEACLKQFADITRDSGRDHKALWERALFRIGQVAGEDSMEYFKKAGLKSQETQSWNAMYGWANTDPAAAGKWLENLQATDPAQWKRLLPAIAAGAALKNPEEGIRLMNSLPEDERRNCVGHFTWNLVQNAGIDRAMDWMKEVVRESGDTPSPYSQAVTNEVLDKMFWSAGNTGGIKEVAGRMEQLSPVMKLDDNRIRQAMGKFWGPTNSLDLLAELSNGPVLQDQASSPTLLPQAITTAIQRNPAKLADWIQKNPSVAFTQSAAVEACRQLQGRGMTGEVERILQALPEGAARDGVRTELGQ